MNCDSYRSKFTIGSHWLLPVTVTNHRECEADDIHPIPVQITPAGETNGIWVEPVTLNAMIEPTPEPHIFLKGDVVEALEVAARRPHDLLTEEPVAVGSRWLVVKEDPTGWVDLTHLSGDDNYAGGEAASIAFSFLRRIVPSEEAQPFYILCGTEMESDLGMVVHWFVLKSPSKARLARFSAIPGTGFTDDDARAEAERLAAALNAAHLSTLSTIKN